MSVVVMRMYGLVVNVIVVAVDGTVLRFNVEPPFAMLALALARSYIHHSFRLSIPIPSVFSGSRHFSCVRLIVCFAYSNYGHISRMYLCVHPHCPVSYFLSHPHSPPSPPINNGFLCSAHYVTYILTYLKFHKATAYQKIAFSSTFLMQRRR